MARIAGVDIPRDKRVVVSLTYIYGIGNTTAKKILADAGVSEDVRVRELTNEQTDAIRAEVDKLKVEGDFVVKLIKHQTFNGNRFLPWYPSPSWIACSWTKH